MLYSIEIVNRPIGRNYVNWCNERWYTTDGNPSPRFTKEATENIISYLKKHYISRIRVTDDTGWVREISYMPRKTTPTNPSHKNIFKLNKSTTLKTKG